MRILLGFIAAAAFAVSTSHARADDWCGFLDQEHARVRCGYSSLDECQQSLGDKKGAFCMPDPNFASRQDNRPARSARKLPGGEG
jgi:hypothetical protein